VYIHISSYKIITYINHVLLATYRMKERVTLTVDTDILHQIDKTVDGFRIKNRSHAVELLLLKSLQTDIAAQAIILAAGKDKRLKQGVPIGMMPVQGNPIIEHLIELFKKFNVKDILIAVCYDKDKIIQHFGNGSHYGVRIRYIEEDEPSGTSNILKRARPFLTGSFFVTNSDELKSVNLTDMYLTHKENNALVTIALTLSQDPKSYGVVSIEGIRIREFREKPKDKHHESKLINAGLYLFELEVIDMIPSETTMFYDFFPVLAEKNKLMGYPFSGQWFDVSSKESYERAEQDWKGPHI
jgi:mannose-1-phosphate guanylyltransferase